MSEKFTVTISVTNLHIVILHIKLHVTNNKQTKLLVVENAIILSIRLLISQNDTNFLLVLKSHRKINKSIKFLVLL